MEFFVVVVDAAEGDEVVAAGRIDDVQLGALGAIPAHIQDHTPGERSLHIQIPHLHIRQTEVLVHRVVAESLGSQEAIGQRDGSALGRLIGLHVGEGRLGRRGPAQTSHTGRWRRLMP